MPDIETAMALIARVQAMPKTHRVVIAYRGGRVHNFETQSLAQAESYAERARRQIGIDVTDPETGETARRVSVDIVKI